MLSQVSHSSKRLDKLKKGRSKLGGSGFQFLLQSMDRDKENHMQNVHTINYGQLSQSVNIESQVTMPISHAGRRQQNKKSGNMFIQDVKILDCSDLSISEASQNTKKPTKKYYNNEQKKERLSMGSKVCSKQSFLVSQQLEKYDTIVQKNGVVIQREQLNELTKKMKQYIILTNENTDGPDHSSKYKSKIKGVSKDLSRLIDKIEQGSAQPQIMSKARGSLESRPTMLRSEIGTNQSQEFARVISQLQCERDKLRGLVSEHQLANIKLFVKMNDGQSQEIQKCKKQLVLLFAKYKQLEKIIKNDKKTIHYIEREKLQITEKYKSLQKTNKQLQNKIKQMHKNQHYRSPSDLALQQLIHQPRSSLRHQQAHSRNENGQSYIQNSINQRYELHIDSLISSRFSDQNGLGSSITTNNSKTQMSKRGTVGINLNSLVDTIKQENFKKLMEEPRKLRIVIDECRKNLISMENVVNQQNKELEFSIKALEQAQEQNRASENIIKQLENKIQSLQQSIKKQKDTKNQIQSNLNKSKIKLTKNTKKGNNPDQKLQQSVVKDDLCLDTIATSRNIDEYRIIATQAQALEKYLGKRKK